MDITSEGYPTNTEWAMLAMAVDCEGSISIMKRKDVRRWNGIQYALRLAVYNSNPLLIDWVQYWFGGYAHTHKGGPNHKDGLSVYFDGNNAVGIIQGILPHLVLKYEIAVLAVEFQDTVGVTTHYRLDQYTLDIREIMYQQAKELNKKGK